MKEYFQNVSHLSSENGQVCSYGSETKIFTKTGSLLLNQKGKGKVLTQYIRSILFPICFIKTQVPMLINLWEKKNVGTY